MSTIDDVSEAQEEPGPTGVSDDGERRAARRWVVPAVATAVGVAVILAWLWPGLVRGGDRLDVVVLGDGEVAAHADTISRRLHERGLRVALDLDVAFCDAAARVADSPASMVVLSYQRAEACDGDATAAWDATVEAAGDRRVLLLVQPGPPPAGQDPEVRAIIGGLEPRRDVIVADPSTLLAEASGSPSRLPCQWWDDCEPDGFVTVRSGEGGPLTPAGGQRLARVLTGAVP